MKTRLLRSIVLASAIGAAVAVASALAENIDPANNQAQYAWGENVGWINAEPAGGAGVTVDGMRLTGFMWGENIGWINLSCKNTDTGVMDGICLGSNTGYYGVYNNGIGGLRGYAWGENVGWISFSCQNVPSTCASTGNYGVTIDPITGQFSGSAWGENIGWINFGHNEAASRIVTGAMNDGDGQAFPTDLCPFDAGGPHVNTDGNNTALGLTGQDNLGDVCDPDDDGDGCNDLEETGEVPDPDPGLEPHFGGDRNPLNYFDFFDVTGDKAVDVADTIQVLQRFGLPPTVATNRYDRMVGPPGQTYRSIEQNDGVDLADAVASLQAFGHNCVAAPMLGP